MKINKYLFFGLACYLLVIFSGIDRYLLGGDGMDHYTAFGLVFIGSALITIEHRMATLKKEIGDLAVRK